MFISKEKSIIIEPISWKKMNDEVKRVLGRLKMKKIAVINIHCLNNKFLEIKNLMNDCAYLKIFHGGSEINFNDILRSFSMEDRKDVMYISGKLESRKVADCYQKYIFQPFSKTFSSSLSMWFREI